jgi:aspartate-semialdehyde dehydrogenase
MPQFKLAIVGSQSLLGREVNGLLAETGLAKEVSLIGADEDTGVLTERDGEPVFITELTTESLQGCHVVFLAGSAASGRRAVQLAAKLSPGPRFIDLSYGCEDLPGYRLRAPMVEPEGYSVPIGSIHGIAHPAAIGLALFLMRIEPRHPIRRAMVHVFEPASERGQRGLDELQQQTINLLAFKKQPKEVFDAQLAFNMLPKFGCEAPQPLEEIEARIRSHVAALQAMDGRKTVPSVRLIQAPVFHGHSFSVWVEFDSAPAVADLEVSLACPQIDVRDQEVEVPSNVGMVGQSGIGVGAIARDPAEPRAVWFWGAADNFKIMAENAIAVARSLMPKTAGGRQ